MALNPDWIDGWFIVYGIYDGEKLLYVGSSRQLSIRKKNHLSSEFHIQPKLRVLRDMPNVELRPLKICDTAPEMRFSESGFIRKFRPPLNTFIPMKGAV